MSASAFQKSEKQVNTAKELAAVAGVSHDTIAKVEKIEQQEVAERIESGEKDGVRDALVVWQGEGP